MDQLLKQKALSKSNKDQQLQNTIKTRQEKIKAGKFNSFINNKILFKQYDITPI